MKDKLSNHSMEFLRILESQNPAEKIRAAFQSKYILSFLAQ